MASPVNPSASRAGMGQPKTPRPGKPHDEPPLAEVGWVMRRSRPAEGGDPSLHELAGLAEELGYPLRYLVGDAPERDEP